MNVASRMPSHSGVAVLIASVRLSCGGLVVALRVTVNDSAGDTLAANGSAGSGSTPATVTALEEIGDGNAGRQGRVAQAGSDDRALDGRAARDLKQLGEELHVQRAERELRTEPDLQGVRILRRVRAFHTIPAPSFEATVTFCHVNRRGRRPRRQGVEGGVVGLRDLTQEVHEQAA